MKILLRKYGDEHYVWKDATYAQGNRDYYFWVDESPIFQTSILAIKDDDRASYVICNHCGTLIKNDPAGIEAHFAEQEAKRDCFHCDNMSIRRLDVLDTQYVKNNDGTYTSTETTNVNLYCGSYSWNRVPIDSPNAKAICKYTQCRKKGVSTIEDIFTQYPDLFDKQVAVDVLNEKNSSYDGYRNGFFVYDLKCHDAVKACVNELGIIDHFIINFRTHTAKAYYSAKYDKLFFARNSEYAESPWFDLSENRYNQAKAKISALYKEAKRK